MAYTERQAIRPGVDDVPSSPLGVHSARQDAPRYPRFLGPVVRSADLGQASYRRDVVLTGVAQFAAATGRITYITLVAHAVGSGGLADASVVIALGTLLSLVTAAGVGPACTRRLASARARNQPDAVLATFYRTRRVAYIGLLGSGCLGGVVYATVFGELWIGLNLVGFVLAYGLYQYYWAVYYGLGRVASYMRSEIRTDLMIVIVAPVVIFAHSLLILPFYLGYAMFIVRAERDISDLLDGFKELPVTSRAKLGREDREDRELWRYAVINAVGTAASMATLQLGVVVAHQALGRSLAGSYAAAYALILPLMYLPRTLATALLPRAAADVARGGREAVQRRLGSLTDFLALMALPLCLVGIVLAHPVLDLVSGSQYSSGVAPLRILLIAAFFLMVSVPAVNILSAGDIKSLATPFLASVAGFVVSGAVWVLSLTHGGGLVAIAIGVLAGSITKSVPPMVVAFRRYGVSPSHLGVATLALVAVGVMGMQGGAMLATASVLTVASSLLSLHLTAELWNQRSKVP